ncbi:D-glucuronyl C5-epimerase family protein [Actinopolymorpha sp. B17G11]|uniref:D-glucuronyl C5-epimerase family protein n=1 Tax=Actinopolymorpha sp. B17G11 TaxID=3160861 RepID=UPI0032E4B4E9
MTTLSGQSVAGTGVDTRPGYRSPAQRGHLPCATEPGGAGAATGLTRAAFTRATLGTLASFSFLVSCTGPRTPEPAGARAPSADVDTRLRNQDDGSAPPGRPVTLPGLPFSFHRDGYEFHDLAPGQLPRGPNVTAPRRDPEPHDDHGVRMIEVDNTLYDHPNYQANFGLENLESHRLTGEGFFLHRAKAQGSRLIDRRVESRGAWFYPYTFDFPLHGDPDDMAVAPWYSGLSQGKALSLFSRLAKVTGEARWRVAADRTFASFLLPPDPARAPRGGGEKPWVVAVDSHQLVWLVQHPRGATLADSDRIFNGHLSGIFGLWEYERLTRNPAALALYDGAITTLRRHVDDLRVPHWRSTYCLTHRAEASNGYHQLHVDQFAQLWLMTREPRFIQFAERLRDDNPYPILASSRTIEFRAGEHVGYDVDIATGRILDEERVSLRTPETGTTVRRMRMKGSADQPGGIYYRVASGPLYDRWVREDPDRTTLRGPVAELAYRGERRARFEGGREYVGTRYDRTGNVVTTERASPAKDADVRIDRTAWVDGAPAAHVTAGPLAGTWVALANVRLD